MNDEIAVTCKNCGHLAVAYRESKLADFYTSNCIFCNQKISFLYRDKDVRLKCFKDNNKLDNSKKIEINIVDKLFDIYKRK